MTIKPLIPLLAPVPPMLEHAFGYYGSADFVAFYLSEVGYELAWVDSAGSRNVDGYWTAWQFFATHPVMCPYLESFDFGSINRTARHWLLLDRKKRLLYVGDAGKVNALLSPQQRPSADILREMTDAVFDSLVSGQITELNKAMDEWDAKHDVRKDGFFSATERQNYVMNAMIVWLNRIGNPGENP